MNARRDAFSFHRPVGHCLRCKWRIVRRYSRHLSLFSVCRVDGRQKLDFDLEIEIEIEILHLLRSGQWRSGG